MTGPAFATTSFLLRSASARYFAAPAFLAGLLQLQGDRLWIGEWDMGLQAAVNYAPVAVFAVAAGSALDARAARQTTPQVTMSARGLPPQVRKVLASASWGYLVLLLLILVTLGTNAAVSPWRTPSFTIVLAGAAWLTLYAASGWLAGWYLPLPIALPLALLTAWLGSAIPAATPDVALALLSGIDDGGFPAGLAPRTSVILVQSVILLALASAALIPPIWRQVGTTARAATVLATVICLVLAGMAISVLGPHRRQELMAVDGPKVCSNIPVPSCSFPDHDDRRQAAAGLAARMWAPMTAAARPLPTGISEDHLAHPRDWISVNLWSSDRFSAAIEIARATTTWNLCDGPANRQHPSDTNSPATSSPRATGQGADLRTAWLIVHADDATPPGPPPAELTPVLRQPGEQQMAWWYSRPTDLECG